MREKVDKLKKFIDKAIARHGNKYDYSETVYVNSLTKVYIICPEHGGFWQQPNNHLMGNKCPECSKLERSSSVKRSSEQFIRLAKIVHGDRYDYSKVEYRGSFAKVTIICPNHGEFEQSPSNHLRGHGCRSCGKKKGGSQ